MLARNRLYLSTIDPAAGDIARQYHLGIEIAEFCTAYNMDREYSVTAEKVTQETAGITRRLFHGPFNELFPCAIDPLARELAKHRFSQAVALASEWNASKIIFHGGYHPKLYFPCWYVEQSVLFWKSFLDATPGAYQICLENVLEETPQMLLEIVKRVNDSRLRLCLDTGHVNAYSEIPVMQWLEDYGDWISHTHIHNNDGTADTHSALSEGTVPMEILLKALPEVTLTLELPEIGNAVQWLLEKELIR